MGRSNDSIDGPAKISIHVVDDQSGQEVLFRRNAFFVQDLPGDASVLYRADKRITWTRTILEALLFLVTIPISPVLLDGPVVRKPKDTDSSFVIGPDDSIVNVDDKRRLITVSLRDEKKTLVIHAIRRPHFEHVVDVLKKVCG